MPDRDRPTSGDGRRGAERDHRLARAIVRLCAPIVPASHRAEWRAEWESELWHRFTEARDERAQPRAFSLTWHASGAFSHALWLLRNEWRLDMFVQDLTYAFRTSLKRPAFTALVVGMLALGIGANTAMFTVVNSVLLQPLPYPHAKELVAMNGAFSKSDEAAISGPDFLDYRAGNRVFASFSGSAYQRDDAVLTGGDAPERVSVSRITADFFATLGVAPLHGRTFVPEENEGDGHDVAILSYGLWQRRFGGDPNAVGSTLSLGGQPVLIVGVMPPVLDQTLATDLWRPYAFHTPSSSVRRFHGMRGIGRLNPGVTIAQAQASMNVIAKQLEAAYPENQTWKLRLRPYQELVVGGADRALLVLLGAVGLVLLIACGNVASLLLARATSRQAEVGIRAALGATRRRLIRQLLTESLVLAAAGGAAGLVLAVVFVRGIRLFGAGLVPRLAEVNIDATVLAFTIIIALGTGLVFGLAPALHTVRSDIASTFASLGRSSGGRAGVRFRDGLVVAQVALSVVLLVGAGLLMRSLWALQAVPPGFEPDHVFTAQIGLPAQRYPDRESQLRFWDAFLSGVRAAPGVVMASATTALPMVGGGDTYYWRADKPPATDADRHNAMISMVAEEYFETMHIALVQGRTFGAAERGGPNAIILNKRLAGQLFENTNPLGQQLVIDFGTPFTGEIVGVVDDVRSYGPSQNPPPTLYLSSRQPGGFGIGYFGLVARTRGDPAAIAGALRTTLASLDRDIPLLRPQPMQRIVSDVTSDTRFAAQLLFAFAGAALLLAVVGLYGVLTYAVAQPTREQPIRNAYGARDGKM